MTDNSASEQTGRLVMILGDQLTLTLSSLRNADAMTDRILMAEVMDEATSVRHHKQKIILVFSAMRHFALELEGQGFSVDYVRLDAAGNTGSLTGELLRAVERHHPATVVLTEPSEWRVRRRLDETAERLPVPVSVLPDDRFLCSRDDFTDWAADRRTLRMEHFYRWMRRRTGWLMSGSEPEGGRWNFDSENRKSWPKGREPIRRRRFDPDSITLEVVELVRSRFGDHFGEIGNFGWPVTRNEALQALEHFITEALPGFGDYQDAMVSGEPFLNHALLSPAINTGLLTPREVGEAVIEAYRDGRAPLPSAEGFIRQVLGWREYIRGIYSLMMPEYPESNALDARRPLPDFYWTGDTSMACLAETISDVRDNAYAHHIQRLMVTGNFALLAGIHPKEVEEWYLIVFADAFEWVELPNTHGMALFADGGLLASKPYAASGAYINRMSDYCGRCPFDPKKRNGPKACPFNPLYWHFLIRNREVLGRLPRMGMAYRNLDRMDRSRLSEIEEDADRILEEWVPER